MEKLREEFDEWALKNGWSKSQLEENDRETGYAWRGYQAGRAALQSALDQVTRERDGLSRELDQEAASHLCTIDDRDVAQDALQQAHIALGGDGEWVTRLPEPEPPESGDLCKDVPVIAAQIFGEAKAAQERAERKGAVGGKK